eukprot:3685556-Rhodomonas_salina.3
MSAGKKEAAGDDGDVEGSKRERERERGSRSVARQQQSLWATRKVFRGSKKSVWERRRRLIAPVGIDLLIPRRNALFSQPQHHLPSCLSLLCVSCAWIGTLHVPQTNTKPRSKTYRPAMSSSRRRLVVSPVTRREREDEVRKVDGRQG